jgi:hypothetical protein
MDRMRTGLCRSNGPSVLLAPPPKPPSRTMLFASFFKTLVGKQITVELKNDLAIVGTLHSVDQVRRPSRPRAARAGAE